MDVDVQQKIAFLVLLDLDSGYCVKSEQSPTVTRACLRCGITFPGPLNFSKI